MLRPITKEDYASGKPVYAVYMGYSKYLEHGIFYNTEYVAARDKIKVRFTINRDILKRQNWGCEFSPNNFFCRGGTKTNDSRRNKRSRLSPVLQGL